MLPKEKMLALKLRGYRSVAATEATLSKSQKCTRRGCVILVDLFLNVQPLKERTENKTELIGIKIIGDVEKTYTNPFEVWTLYSGPNHKEAKKCSHMLEKLSKDRKCKLIVAGDFNSNLAPNLKKGSKNNLRVTLEKMEEKGRATIINNCDEYTTPNKSTIDLAVIMGVWEPAFAYPIQMDLSSTHFPVCIGISTEENKVKQQYEHIPRYKSTKQSAKLLQESCKKMLANIEQYTADSLTKSILESVSEAALITTRKKRKRKQNHWWNDEIEELYSLKQKLLSSNNGKKDKTLLGIEEKLLAAISKAKNESFQEFASELNHQSRNHSVFRAMKCVGSRRPSRIAELSIISKNGNIVTNLKEKANLLSRRYQVPLGYHPTRDELRRKRLKTRRKSNEKQHPIGTNHIPFTTDEARIAREDLSNNKTPGLSRIRKEDLAMGKDGMDALAAELANKVTTSGKWPEVLKKAVVCPLPKSNDVLDMIEEDKTRPISLLETLDKWLERIIYNRVSKYINYNETQAGYSLSCDHHTSLVSDFVMNRKDKAYTIAVFTDISKAFDSVPLDELVDVIWNSSIPAAYKWVIASFIEGRQFRVEIKDANGNVSASKWRKMLYGTPQGSILGPMLWNLFFDPLLERLQCLREETDRLTVETNSPLDKQTNPQSQEPLLQRLEELKMEMNKLFQASKEVADSINPRNREEELQDETQINGKTARLADTASQGEQPTKPADLSKEQQTTNNPETTSSKAAVTQITLESLDVAFADDLNLLAASTIPRLAEILLEQKLIIFKKFLTERGMEAATHKLKVMCLDPLRRNFKPIIYFDNHIIEVVDANMFLGILYDKNMSFDNHWTMVAASVSNRTKTMMALRSASWGPTRLTMKVLHHSYIESVVRYGMPAWYPFLSNFAKTRLEVILRRALRIVTGLPIHTWNEALSVESDLDSANDLYLKSIISLYSRINPTDDIQDTLAKKSFITKTPIWAKDLKKIPKQIWVGPIQRKLSKKVILATSKVKVEGKTLESQAEADIVESNYEQILYTDASVDQLCTPPGKAATAFIWYKKATNGEWEVTSSQTAYIGSGHSSYTAEAIAITEGLQDAANQIISTLKTGVFTDSLSNLQTIKKGVAETPEQENLLRAIRDLNTPLTFHHVRSHQDNQKNNASDSLCNISRPMIRTDLSHLSGKLTSDKIKTWTKTWIRSKRLNRVTNNRYATIRKSATQEWMKRNLLDKKRTLNPPPKTHSLLSRKKGVLLAKARTNRWTQCNWYLHFIKRWKTSKCSKCDVEDTTDHTINTCSLHNKERADLRKKLQHTGPISTLLASDKDHVAESLADFLIKIQEVRKNRNSEEELQEETKTNGKTAKEQQKKEPNKRIQRTKGILKTSKTQNTRVVLPGPKATHLNRADHI